MSVEITSLGGIEYFKDQQCIAFLEIPQNHSEDEKIIQIQGVLSYQSDGISFSFLIESTEAFKSRNSIDPKYETLYILGNKKRYTIYKPYFKEISSHTLGNPPQITLHYEWLFDDWINPERISGEYLICRTNYLEHFFTSPLHLSYDGKESKAEDQTYDFFTFKAEKGFLTDDDGKIRAGYQCRFPSPKQRRLFSGQYDLFLKYDTCFTNFQEAVLISEAIRNFFVLVFAHSDADIQIDYIQFHQNGYDKNITAIRNTYTKDKEQIRLDPFDITLPFQRENFSSMLDRWIDFCIKNKDSQYIANMLLVINEKKRSIHLYSDLLFLISMIDGFVQDQGLIEIDEEKRQKESEELQNAIKVLQKSGIIERETIEKYEKHLQGKIKGISLKRKFTAFFEKALDKTQCRETKEYFNDKCRDELCKTINKYRSALAHGGDLKIDKEEVTKISNAYTDLKQIIIEYFFSEIGLSQFIPHNRGFSRTLFRRNPKENR